MPGREIINVTESDFEFEVIAYSKNTPVVVDFWAEWCQPCKVLTPLLEKLVGELGGSFRLAKVDVDANPNLAARFNVRSIPTVIAFSDAAPRDQLIGVQSEPRLRAFLEAITPPSPLSLAIEKANGLLSAHKWAEAETEFRQILAKENDIPGLLAGANHCPACPGEGIRGQAASIQLPRQQGIQPRGNPHTLRGRADRPAGKCPPAGRRFGRGVLECHPVGLTWKDRFGARRPAGYPPAG